MAQTQSACHLEETAETQLDAIHGCEAMAATDPKQTCSGQGVSRLGNEQAHGVQKAPINLRQYKASAMGMACVHDASAIFARAEALALVASAGARRTAPA